MQIRLAGAEQQSKLKGNVINVENDFDVCASVLPRNMTETSVVQVQLLRKLQYQRPVWHESIQPYKVQKAMEYLINTESYRERNITLSDRWRNFQPGDVVPFQSVDQTSEPGARGASEVNVESDDDDDEQLARVYPTETLAFDLDSTTMGYRIAPGEGKRPVPFLQDVDMEEVTFPTIFGGQKRKLKAGVKLTITDLFKSKIRNRNRICVKNPTYLLYLFKKSFNHKVRDAIRVVMRKQRTGEKISAKDLRTPGFLEKTIQIDNGYVVFQGVRSTPAYWKSKQKKVVSMIRQLGKCSFFITLSAAETKWVELIVILHKIVHKSAITEEEAMQLSFQEVSELIRADPVTCMRHFDHKFRAFTNTLLQPTPPRQGIFSPYDVTDYFSRIEFQARGSPHIHGLFWMKDAPIYDSEDIESEQAVIEFIDKFITCERENNEEMAELVRYQNHKHSHTCRRMFGNQRKCRFRFPQPPLPRTMVIKPHEADISTEDRKRMEEHFSQITNDLESKGMHFEIDIPFNDYLQELGLTMDQYLGAIRTSITRATIFLKRKTNACFINGYNRNILRTWRANIDIQYVLDTYACAKYCVNYISKAEGGVSKLLKACMRDIQRGNHTIKEQLTRFGSTLINAPEVSTQEASAFLSSLPNTFCTRQDVYVNTARPDDRIAMLRPRIELEGLADDSEDIYAPGLIDHYIKRPRELDAVCLAEFACNYNRIQTRKRRIAQNEDESDNDDDDSRSNQDATLEEDSDGIAVDSSKYKLRKVRKILRYRHFSKVNDEEEYWREQLMLFVPWRNEELELLNIDHKEKAKENIGLIQENSQFYYFNRAIDEEVIQNDLNAAEHEEERADIPNDPDQLLIDEEESEAARQFITEKQGNTTAQRFLPPRFIPDDEYYNVMRTLNEKQRKYVLHTLHLLKTSGEPFYSFLHGGAGVGKSHTITAIVQSYLRYVQSFPSETPDCPPVLVTAFTGKAAFNVFGMTLSSAFRLPPLQNKQAHGNLDDGAANSLRAKLHRLKLLIIDEISMVGVRMLYDVDSRLKQIMCNKKPFGGISVIVVGHLRQLMPIGDSWVFKVPTHLRGGQLGSLWDMFRKYELDEIMRQQGDIPFCKALNNMADGIMDAEDVRLIRSREISVNLTPPKDAIWLFQTNAECATYNQKIHSELPTEGVNSIAVDHIEGAENDLQLKERMLEKGKTLTVMQCDGLRYEVPLKVGAVYLVSTNIDVSDGLFNGADGVLMRIDYGTTADNQRVPYRVWLQFKDPLVGVHKRGKTKDYQSARGIPLAWVPIEKISRNLSKAKQPGASLIRSQFPLLAANAMTIAKAQGSTLSNVVLGINPIRKLEREQKYVACSRATSLQGLFIQGIFRRPRMPPINDPVTKELDRLNKKGFQMSLKFLQDIPCSYRKLYFHNVQSLPKYAAQAFSDQCVSSADVVVFVEPKLPESYEIPSQTFRCLFRQNARVTGNTFNSEGGVILVKQDGEILETIRRQSDGAHLVLMVFLVFGTVVTAAYKHPNYPQRTFLNSLEEVLRKYSARPLIFVGDINTDLNSADGRRCISDFQKYGLTPKILPTSPSTNLGTTIDCCFSNLNLDAWYYETYYSYHKAVCAVWSC